MMDEESYRVIMLDSNGGTIQGTFLLTEDPSSDRISLKLEFEGQCIVKTADDYFEAMCEIRRELEKKNLKLNCYGASKNVYPSGMCRDMGMGLKAYKMRLGIHVRMSDLVAIFETGTDVEPSTVEEQHNFFQQWASQPKQSAKNE